MRDDKSRLADGGVIDGYAGGGAGGVVRYMWRSADGGATGGNTGGQSAGETSATSTNSNSPAEDANNQPSTQPENEQKQPENPLAYWQAQAQKFERLHKRANDEAQSAKALLEQLQNETVKQLTEKFNALQQELEAERKRASEATTEALRAKVAGEFKLGGEALGFLTGSDEATLRQQAEALSKLTGKPTPTPTGSVGNPANTGGLTMDDIKKMSQSEIAKRMDEVSQVLAGKK